MYSHPSHHASKNKGQKVSCTCSKLEEGFISSYFLLVFFLRYSDASALGDFSFSRLRLSCIWLFKANLYPDAIPPGPKVGSIACQLR